MNRSLFALSVLAVAVAVATPALASNAPVAPAVDRHQKAVETPVQNTAVHSEADQKTMGETSKDGAIASETQKKETMPAPTPAKESSPVVKK